MNVAMKMKKDSDDREVKNDQLKAEVEKKAKEIKEAEDMGIQFEVLEKLAI